MGKLFKTGWQRKPRDGNGKIITQTQSHGETVHVEKKNEGSVVESVKDVVKDGTEGIIKAAKDADGQGKKVEVIDVMPAVKDATPAL